MPHGKTYAILAAEGIVARAKQVIKFLLMYCVFGADNIEILTEDDESRKLSMSSMEE